VYYKIAFSAISISNTIRSDVQDTLYLGFVSCNRYISKRNIDRLSAKPQGMVSLIIMHVRIQTQKYYYNDHNF